MKNIFWTILFMMLFTGCCGGNGHSGTVTLGTLLEEMLSPEETVLWPETPYTCQLVSSHDRSSTTSGTPAWFANNDGFGYIRTDTIAGRAEKVLFEEQGPGVITRIWLTTHNPAGVMRFYFDGQQQPGWVVPAYDLMQFGLTALGQGLLQPHTSYEPGVKGGNTLYLPIPYANGCRVTFEEPAWMNNVPHYYQFNFRKYSADTQIETFSIQSIEKYRDILQETDHLLQHPDEQKLQGRESFVRQRVAPGDTLTLILPEGTRMVTRTCFDIRTDSSLYEQTMRGLIFRASFDGKETVWTPLSDFSGGGMGAPTVESWFLCSDGRGGIVSRWPMPYRKDAEISICNSSKHTCEVSLTAYSASYRWQERSLYFHTAWKQERELSVKKLRDACYDWNFVTLHGRGVYKGDLLSLFNHSRAWYGEGDEKIWVDDERFPSHFGTGVEDYYNSSWAPVYPFHTPFGGAPRADLKNSQGYNAFFRTRNLDGIPFFDRLKFDMEMLGWIDGSVDYATTVYWYGDLDSSAKTTSGSEEVGFELLPRPADPADFRIPSAIEFEKLGCIRKSDRLQVSPQNMAGFPEGMWSGQSQIVGFGGVCGDFAEFELDNLSPAKYRLCIYATQATDYGRVRFTTNGGQSVEFDSYCDHVTNSGRIELKGVDLPDGKLTLKVEIVGKSPSSKGLMFGLDCMTLTQE